eukprot:scaffold236565_cov47-Prasinocladus_malaysianus.AAC.1
MSTASKGWGLCSPTGPRGGAATSLGIQASLLICAWGTARKTMYRGGSKQGMESDLRSDLGAFMHELFSTQW